MTSEEVERTNDDTASVDDSLDKNHDQDQKVSSRKRKKDVEDDRTEEDIERLAVEMILKESKRNKCRADQLGAGGWSANDRPRANKRFAKNVIVSAVMGNKLKKKQL